MPVIKKIRQDFQPPESKKSAARSQPANHRIGEARMPIVRIPPGESRAVDGIRADEWQALGLAITFLELVKEAT